METYINRDLRENLLVVFMHMNVQHFLNTENAIYVMSGWHRIKIGKRKYTNIALLREKQNFIFKLIQTPIFTNI